jgi:hypothetical protein
MISCHSSDDESKAELDALSGFISGMKSKWQCRKEALEKEAE